MESIKLYELLLPKAAEVIVRRCSMAVSGKYGTLNIPNVGDDEPVFILRAQDKLAASAIEMYRVLAASHSSPAAEDLEKAIDAFRRWNGPKKIPD
jgi:hypothetical protein